MGLAFTLLFIVTASLSPQIVMPALAPYHVGIWLAVLAGITSMPDIARSRILLAPQALFVAWMTLAVAVSVAVNGWLGGAVHALDLFLPSAFTFVIIAANFRSVRTIKVLIVVLWALCAVIILAGWYALHSQNFTSPFLLTQSTTEGSIYRLRGTAFFADPNDLAQLMVSLIPLLTIFWRRRHLVQNLFFVVIPSVVLVLGMYLTHSRGSLIALAAIVLFSLRKRIGLVPSAAIAAVMFVGIKAMNWSGGRAISIEEGSGRMDAWGVGLQLFRMHPLFGVGFNNFTEYFDITAHNSIVVCAAEIGIFGFLPWIAIIVCTVSDLLAIRQLPLVNDGDSASTEPAVTPSRMATSLTAALVGFLTAGFFLSRAYTLTLFIFTGLAAAVHSFAAEAHGIENVARPPMARIAFRAAAASLGALVLVYVTLRLRSLF